MDSIHSSLYTSKCQNGLVYTARQSWYAQLQNAQSCMSRSVSNSFPSPRTVGCTVVIMAVIMLMCVVVLCF